MGAEDSCIGIADSDYTVKTKKDRVLPTGLVTSALRYPGGKSKALKMILPRIFDDFIKNYGEFKEYREPFVGGGSVFIALRQKLGDKKIRYKINDLNTDLYSFWKYAKKDPDALMSNIIKEKESTPNGKALYQKYHNYKPKTELERAAKFFILNRITFSGNTDSGGYSQEAFEKRFTDSSIVRIEALTPLLENVKIYNDRYKKLLSPRGKNVFIYLDPPYYSAMKSELYGKNGDLHKTFNHKKFAKDMKRCSHNWLITYDNCPEIQELFVDFAHIYPWKLQYGVNYGKEISKIGNELFISNYDIPSLKSIN